MISILKEILKEVPNKAEISEALFEGANIVLYTKNREFFLDNNGIIKEIVNKIKKRIEVRPDPSLALGLKAAEKEIRKIIPEEAGINEITFDPTRSRVIIETDKPGVAIGKTGELLREIRKNTMWVPTVKRTPAIRSKIIENIRTVLYENNDFRKKFLNSVGERIYAGYTHERRNEWVRVTFLGGAREVGRSCLLLQTPESKILLDCGINTAADQQNAYPFFDAPEFNINDIDAVVISHAHLDHCGMVPLLFKFGYTGPIYCTAPTRDTMSLLALDFIGVAYKEAKEGLFTVTDVKEMVKHTICLDYEEVYDITPDVRITLYNAGHTLGSAMVHLHIGNGLHNLLYTGDFKYVRTRALEPAVSTFPRLETLIIESTYGGKDNNLLPRKESEQQLIETINRILERGGKALVPVLGTGRAQEIMLILEEAIKAGKIKEIPIYVQGMVWDVTAIHTAYPDFLDKNIRKGIFHKDHNPFLSPIFKRVGSAKERQDIIKDEGPCVILATSGMLTGGASVEFFKEMAEDARHAIIFVSYLGVGSLGRRVQSGEKDINISSDGKTEMIRVRMEVVTIDGLSGHAGRSELVKFVSSLEPQPKKIIINHGESSRCLDLASSLHKLRNVETNAPKDLEAIRIK